MGMKKYKLGEIGEIRMCKRILKEETNSVGGVPFYKIGTFGGQADVFITKEKFKEYKNAYSYPKKGDILISAAGTIGRTVVFDGKDAYFQDSNIVWIENDESKVLNEYLFYCYKNIRWTTSVGSTILRLYNDDIRNTDIIVPHLSEQKKISSVLSSLDDKITLNKKINAKLEAMAKRLYDYWFVQFDFPNEEGKPYKTSGGKMVWNEVLKRKIPEGWEVVQIQSILDKYPSTKRFNTSEYLYDGKYPIVDQDSSSFIAGYTNEENGLLKQFPAVLFGDHSTCVKFLNFEFCRGADGTQILYSNEDRIKPYYLYLAVKSLIIPNQGYSRHFKYLKELPVILPSLELADKFQKIVKPTYEKKTKCDKQIEKLSRLRDRLLPLLMNGQVEVEG